MISWYQKRLNTLILAALILSLVFAFLTPGLMSSLDLVGDIFIQLLSMLIVPIIIFSMLAGVLNLGSTEMLGALGLKAVGYYMLTTALAVLLGLCLVNVIKPGQAIDSENSEVVQTQILEVPHDRGSSDVEPEGLGIREVVKNIVPTNVFKAAADGNVLGLIFFSVFLGVAILHLEESPREKVADFVSLMFNALIWMVDRVMLLAPIGVFCLVGNLLSESIQDGRIYQLGAAIGAYAFTVSLGLLAHGLLTLGVLCFVFGVNPFKCFVAMFPAISTAFSTASSAVTLPVTLDALEKRAGVSNQTASFVAPLGATVNMDGTAIYEAVAALFIANVYGVELSFSQQLTVFLTATFSAIGAAGIPGAGLVMMTLVLKSVGLPLEGIQLIIVCDRLLDMLRTAVNVWGDSVGCVIIDRGSLFWRRAG